MKINLGSNVVKYDGFLNLDIRDIPEVDIVDDVRTLSKIQDGSVEFIIAHNILEHFSQDNVKDILLVWTRKLSVGGVIEIGVPDGEMIFERYKAIGSSRKQYKECPWEDVIHSIFGNIKLLRRWHGEDAEKYMHHILFNKDYLKKLMSECGLVNILQVDKNHKDNITLRGTKGK